MKTILATTYAVNPYKGSEDGMGWNFICQIARYHKVIAITRQNNQPAIEKYMQEHPNSLYQNITFTYFDLPYWMRFWKKGGRGAMLYYWMWQKGIVSFIKKQSLSFDLVHNVNFHNDWTPSYLWKLGKPMVWGPIGHHPSIPTQYLGPYSPTYYVKEKWTWMVKQYFWKWSPDLKRTKQKAEHILCMNSSVADVLTIDKSKYTICPSVATEDFGFQSQDNKEKYTLISAGRMVPLKGFDLTIAAYAQFLEGLTESEKQKTELVLVGSGPEENLLQKQISDLKLNVYVKCIPWIAREALMQLFKDSSAFIFPSHEGAGMVVAEAMSFGLPVICLDNSGPGEFIDQTSGISITVQNRDNTILELSKAINTLYAHPNIQKSLSLGARKRFESAFHWDRRGDLIDSVYTKIFNTL